MVFLALVVAPAGASAALSLNQSIAPTSTAAAAHPDLVLTSNLPGSPDLASLTYSLPAGLAIAPAAVASPCSTSAATAGTCPAAAKIGTVSIVATGGVSASGDVFLTAPASSSHVAGIAIKATASGGLGNVIFQGGLSFNLNGSTQQSESFSFPSIPSTTSSGAALHITQLSLTLLGSTGAPAKPLVTNPSACPTTSVTGTTAAIGTDGSSAQSITSYPVTSCSAVPASQTLDASLTDPTAGHETNTTVTMSMPSGSSALNYWTFKLGDSIGFSYPATGGPLDRCPPTSGSGGTTKFVPSTCPAQAVIGSLSVTSPLFAAPLNGNLYIISSSPLFRFGFDLEGQGTSIKGNAGVSTPQNDPTCEIFTSPTGDCPGQWQITLYAPSIPVTQLKFSLAGASGRRDSGGTLMQNDVLYVASPPACISPNVFTSTAALLRGAPTVGASLGLGLFSCGAADPPNTTITSLWFNTPTNLPRPTFRFTGTAGTNSFECAIDSSAYVACSSGWAPTAALMDGTHTFKVRAVGTYGADPTPATGQFIVDTTKPNAPVISSPSEGSVLSTTPAPVTFSGESGASFYCAVDSGSSGPCTSPFTTGLLGNGTHTVSVTQVDTAQNQSPTTVRSFVVQSPLSLNQSIAPTSTAAAAHPDLVLTSNLPGSPDLASLTYSLPAGLAIAPAAVASPCSTSAATAGTCPAAAKIGTVSIVATGGVSASGDVFLTAPASSSHVAGIAIKATASGGLGNVIFQGGLSFDLNGSTQQSELISFPAIPSTTSSSAPLHITQLSLTLLGSTGAPNKPLVTNPSACPTTSVSATTAVGGTDGSSAQAITSYPVTACSSVPASATLDVSLTNPTANSTTSGTFTVDMPLGSSAAKTLNIKTGQSVVPNLYALGSPGDRCPVSGLMGGAGKFNPSTCPPRAAIGTFAIQSPLFTLPLEGTVYSIGSTTYAVGFDLRSDGVSIRGFGVVAPSLVDQYCDPATSTTGDCAEQANITLFMPTIPVTQAKLTLGAPASHLPLQTDLLVVQPDIYGCVSPNSMSLTVALLRGAPAANATKAVAISGC